MKREISQQAFPGNQHLGMSLRDYASIEILSAMITSAPVVDRSTVNKALWSRMSFDWADAWLKERRIK